MILALKQARLAVCAIAAVVGLLAGPAGAQTPSSWVMPSARSYAGFERLTLSDGSAHGLASIPSKDGSRPVRYAWLVIEGGDVRFRLDGDTTLPTSSVGVPLRNGADLPLTIDDASLAKLRFIRTTAVSIDIWVLYFY